MKIPKRVNAALDWMGRNARIVAAVGAALIISISVWWIPLLSAFVLGIAIGGISVHQRMAARQAALRTDIDDLLRQNGALRREKLSLASGVIAKQTQLTAKLPVIPEDREQAGAGDRRPRGAAATHPGVPAQTNPLRQPDATPQTEPADRTGSASSASSASSARSRRSGRATSTTRPDPATKGESRATRTAKLPVIPDDPGEVGDG